MDESKVKYTIREVSEKERHPKNVNQDDTKNVPKIWLSFIKRIQLKSPWIESKLVKRDQKKKNNIMSFNLKNWNKQILYLNMSDFTYGTNRKEHKSNNSLKIYESNKTPTQYT